jgi:hypothetical protein
MTFETEFADLMPHTVVVRKQTSLDKYGVAARGAATTVQGRVVQTPKMVRLDDGREVVSSAHFYTAGPAGILTTDEITLPDGSTPVIMRVDHYPDEDGSHHEVVWF